MGIKLTLAMYQQFVVEKLEEEKINVQDKNINQKLKEFFTESNTTIQTDGSEEYLDDNEINEAIALAKEYAQELKNSKGEKPSMTPVQAQASSNAPETGNVVAIVCENGATCQIKGTTITTFIDGTSTSREMTEEEQKLTTNELIEQLKKANTLESKVAEKQVQETPAEAKESVDNSARKITGNGISGTYAFIEKEDGSYTIEQNFAVSAYKNQAYKAYTNGMKNEFGTPQVKPDSNGVFCFRKDAAKLYDTLNMTVQKSAKDIAIKTEIYKDLQARQNNGDGLSSAELNFMQDYNNLLQQCGLQMNANGELEDIPTQTKRKRG